MQVGSGDADVVTMQVGSGEADVDSGEVDEQTERVRKLSLVDIGELIAKRQAVETQLQQAKEAMERAVESADYGRAAEMQSQLTALTAEAHELNEAHLISDRMMRKRAREVALAKREDASAKAKAAKAAASGGGSILPPASDVVSTANDVWDKRIEEGLAPLKSAQETVFFIVQNSLRLAAGLGVFEIEIRTLATSVALTIERCVNSASETLDFMHTHHRFTVHGSFHGDALAETVLSQYWYAEIESMDAERREILTTDPTRVSDSQLIIIESQIESDKAWSLIIDAVMQKIRAFLSPLQRLEYIVDLEVCWVPVGKELTDEDIVAYADNHKLISSLLGFTPKIDVDPAVGKLTSIQLLEMARTFDAETLHNSPDFKKVMESKMGRQNTLWHLGQAGYEASLLKLDTNEFALNVAYRHYERAAADKTFRQYLQATVEGDWRKVPDHQKKG